jgi:hypothetical protein
LQDALIAATFWALTAVIATDAALSGFADRTAKHASEHTAATPKRIHLIAMWLPASGSLEVGPSAVQSSYCIGWCGRRQQVRPGCSSIETAKLTKHNFSSGSTLNCLTTSRATSPKRPSRIKGGAMRIIKIRLRPADLPQEMEACGSGLTTTGMRPDGSTASRTGIA